MVRRPIVGGYQAEHGTDRRRLDDEGENLGEVDVGPLMEAEDHPTCLVAVECAVGIKLDAEDPFVDDDTSDCRRLHECPCALGYQRVKFNLHSCSPVWVLQSFTRRGEEWGQGGSCGCQRVLRVGFEDAGFGTRRHVVTRRGRNR